MIVLGARKYARKLIKIKTKQLKQLQQIHSVLLQHRTWLAVIY